MPNNEKLFKQALQAQRVRQQPEQQPAESFQEFSASELYCNNCKRAMPVRQKMLLMLPNGGLYDYLCSGCNTSLGTRTEN